MNVYQCKLKLADGSTTIGWIEERGAKVGHKCELLEDGKFWEVVEVYQPPLEEKVLKEKQKRDRDCLPSIRGE